MFAFFTEWETGVRKVVSRVEKETRGGEIR